MTIRSYTPDDDDGKADLAADGWAVARYQGRHES